MIITKDEYPNIFAAIEASDGDTLKVPVRDVPNRWGTLIPKIEETLGKLSKTERAPESPALAPHIKPDALLDSELYAFCNGEYHEMTAIQNRSLEFTTASLFLDDMYEDWELTSDQPTHSPENVARSRRLEWLNEVKNESPSGVSPEQTLEIDQLWKEII